jgi:hypothetical protein
MVKRSLSVASATQRRGSVDPSADAALAKMGYASELPRNLSMLSVLGMYGTSFLFIMVLKFEETELVSERQTNKMLTR